MKKLFATFALLGVLASPWPAGMAAAESISGEACYTYGPGETLIGAKHISISLAKRKALEGYAVFAEATVNMQDPQLRNVLVANLTARVMKDVQITKSQEDAQKREVCSAIQAEVEPELLRDRIAAVSNAFRNRNQASQAGLPESEYLRVIRMDEFPCAFDKAVQCLNLVTECKKSGFGERLPIRIIWYDAEGRPVFSINRRVGCERARDVGNIVLRLPPGNYTFKVDLP